MRFRKVALFLILVYYRGIRAFSLVGRALLLQSRGQEFESPKVHKNNNTNEYAFVLFYFCRELGDSKDGGGIQYSESYEEYLSPSPGRKFL